ncbi:MAG: tRNA (guanosine(37)-N1)-methyltransferase TrmD, partial [Clostridia bacterium]|nr:tRNA (guanosine(37)-N1)-methyltransferase TrmD [Clostridia bacterium]
MRFDIMTLFPDFVTAVLGESIIGRAQKAGAIEVNTYNIRDYSKDKHRRVDDTPYGGGRGMLMMAPPIYDCYADILAKSPDAEKRRV